MKKVLKTKTAAARQRPTQLKPQKFITTIVKDPKNPPRLQVIQGFIGRSSEARHVRIYLDMALRRYVDIPTAGVVHSELIRSANTTVEGVYVWVTEETQITHHGSWVACDDPTTMATGEEGGPDPTTMATGEECGGFENPFDLVGNPFGRF